MIFGISKAELDALQVDAAAERQSCCMRRARCRHLVTATEVVAQPDVELIGRQELRSQHKVVDEDAARLEFLAGCEIVIRGPARQVNHRERDTDGGMAERLGEAYLQVCWQVVALVAEALYLSAKITCYSRKTPYHSFTR